MEIGCRRDEGKKERDEKVVNGDVDDNQYLYDDGVGLVMNFKI